MPLKKGHAAAGSWKAVADNQPPLFLIETHNQIEGG
jgi:hypothetical protein